MDISGDMFYLKFEGYLFVASLFLQQEAAQEPKDHSGTTTRKSEKRTTKRTNLLEIK